jgi:Phage integrase, N-terminal SAM-like domain
MFLMTDSDLRVDDSGAGWALSGPAAPQFTLVNDFLGYLADRRYSPRTVRAYAFDLLAFCRWLLAGEAELADVTAEMLLRYLAHCRERDVPPAAGRQRVLDPGRPQHRLRGGDHQPADGRGLGAVRVPGDVEAEVAGLIQTYPARRAPGCRRGRHGHRPAVRGGQGAEPGAAPDR